jgi:hypothetical protein
VCLPVAHLGHETKDATILPPERVACGVVLTHQTLFVQFFGQSLFGDLRQMAEAELISVISHT